MKVGYRALSFSIVHCRLQMRSVCYLHNCHANTLYVCVPQLYIHVSVSGSDGGRLSSEVMGEKD